MSKYEEGIEKLLTDDSFVAWIEGTASEKVAARWERWLELDPARKSLVEEARSLHKNINFKESRRSEEETELIKLQEAVDRVEEQKEWKKKARFSQISNKKSYSSVAAVLLLLVTVLSIIVLFHPDFYPSETVENTDPKLITKSTQNGQQKVLTLYDGSTITLNANSRLTYPSQSSGGDLEVRLEGEAYFDIVHETGVDTRTLAVNVPGGTVQVLGTKFNVNTYEEAAEVVLVQGRVDIKMRDTLGQIKDSYVMNPGELSRISQLSESINTSKVEADMYTAWTQDKLVFDQTPLTEIAERIKHIYGVRFQLNGHELKETLVSGSLPNNNLEVFLNTLENMLDRPVTNKGGLIILGEQSINK